MSSDLFHIQHASMQFSDRDRAFQEDIDIILGRGAHVVGLTEVGDRFTALRSLCNDHEYRLVQPVNASGRRVSTALAIQNKLHIRESGWDFVIPGQAGLARNGGHSARGITFATVRWEGNIVTLNEAHWVTGYGRSRVRRDQHIAQTKAMIEKVKQTGRGSKLSFFMGDINWDKDDPTDELVQDLFARGGLETVWTEVGYEKGTHGRRTIDIIGSYRRDRRVKAERVKVWKELHSDHRQISAWYNVRAPRR